MNTAWMCWGRQSRFRVRTSWTRCVTASLSPRAEKGDCCFQIWLDTVREQLSIARQKAGIGEDETDVQLERFEVIRHGAKS